MQQRVTDGQRFAAECGDLKWEERDAAVKSGRTQHNTPLLFRTQATHFKIIISAPAAED